MPDLEISKLPPISGSLLQATDPLPVADLSASETKSVTVKQLIQGGIALIDDKSIPSDKVNLVIPAGSVGTTELADKSVTAAKLDDASTTVITTGVPVVAGSFVGQFALDNNSGKLYVWDGTNWDEPKAAGSINTLTYDNTLGPFAMGGVVSGDNVELGVVPKNTTSGGQFLAGPTTAGGVVDYREIFSVDLPTASAEKGAVAVIGNGLTMTGDVITIDNVADPLPASVYGVVRYDTYGLVTEGRVIISTDLPIATASEIGAIRPGPSFAVSANGELALSNGVAPGTATKVTYDSTGLITNGTNLTPDDIPFLPADKLTSGELPVNVIGDRSIIESKLADYSTCFIQEGQPSSNPKIGQFWFTPSTNQLRVYSRGSAGDLWLSVGFGALQAQNLRWAGTINADTSTIVSVTAIGTSEGLVAGSPIPVPTDELSGIYFVVQVAGIDINQPNVEAESFTEGDWLLCIDQAQGYTHIDTAADGGGGPGGGVRYLNDLLDVEIGGNQGPFGTLRISLAGGQLLQYDEISGQWVNNDVVNGGTY